MHGIAGCRFRFADHHFAEACKCRVDSIACSFGGHSCLNNDIVKIVRPAIHRGEITSFGDKVVMFSKESIERVIEIRDERLPYIGIIDNFFDSRKHKIVLLACSCAGDDRPKGNLTVSGIAAYACGLKKIIPVIFDIVDVIDGAVRISLFFLCKLDCLRRDRFSIDFGKRTVESFFVRDIKKIIKDRQQCACDEHDRNQND